MTLKSIENQLGHPNSKMCHLMCKYSSRVVISLFSQISFLFAVGGREDCHNPCNVKWGFYLSYCNMSVRFIEIAAIEVIHLIYSVGPWFLRPWTFQSQWTTIHFHELLVLRRISIVARMTVGWTSQNRLFSKIGKNQPKIYVFHCTLYEYGRKICQIIRLVTFEVTGSHLWALTPALLGNEGCP